MLPAFEWKVRWYRLVIQMEVTVVEDDDLAALSRLEQVERLKNGLLARAQGGTFAGGDTAYRAVRQELRRDAVIYAKLPSFVRSCSSLDEYWGFIQSRFASYHARREFLREAFEPVIEYLESNERNPGVVPVGEHLARFDAETVHAIWQKALDRRLHDPEGAITAARSLVETVCKHILDSEGVSYGENEDLPKLWHLTAERLHLAPHQHQEATFKAILGNCQAVVNNLATIRNRVGDAHGQGRRPVKPKPRHAELAVNLAGSMAAFLVATWDEHTTHGKARS